MSVVEHVNHPGLLTLLYYDLTRKYTLSWCFLYTPVVIVQLLGGYITSDTFVVLYFWLSMVVAFWRVCELLFGFPLCAPVVILLNLCGLEMSTYMLRFLLSISTIFGTILIFYLMYTEK